jgi:hypothetical protein
MSAVFISTNSKFKVGDACFDIITYTVAHPVTVEDVYIDNGHYKYLVRDAERPKRTLILREQDMVRRNTKLK